MRLPTKPHFQYRHPYCMLALFRHESSHGRYVPGEKTFAQIAARSSAHAKLLHARLMRLSPTDICIHQIVQPIHDTLKSSPLLRSVPSSFKPFNKSDSRPKIRSCHFFRSQYDAAVDSEVARTKVKGESKVAGRASVLIVPDLNVGNIVYKVRTLSGPLDLRALWVLPPTEQELNDSRQWRRFGR